MCVTGALVASVSHWVTQLLPAGSGVTQAVCLEFSEDQWTMSAFQTSRQTSPNDCAGPTGLTKKMLYSHLRACVVAG